MNRIGGILRGLIVALALIATNSSLLAQPDNQGSEALSGAQPPAEQPRALEDAGAVESSESNQGSDTKQSPESKPDQSSTPAEGSESTNPVSVNDVGFEKFQKLINEMKTNEQTVNQLVISMPIGFPEKRKMQQARIASLRQRNVAILDEIHAAALESFENFPNTQQAVNNYLMQHLQKHLTGKNYRKYPFDPVAAMKLYKMLADGGVSDPILSMFGYRTHYLLNDFDKAEIELRKAAEERQVDPRAFEDLKTMKAAWQEELALREQDAQKENPHVQIEMDCGTLVVELFEDQVPNTVANFITLVEDGFYNGLLFYQVNPTEVALTGSPSNDGQGGPGYNTIRETNVADARHHFGGVLSMLTNGESTDGSRFLITKQPRLQYDRQITPFGRIIEGIENLYRIKVVNRTVALSRNDTTRPTQILTMKVLRKRDHEYIAEKASTNPAAIPGG